MNKIDKVKKLDMLLLDKMIEWVESDETNRLPELSNAIAYVKANNVVEVAKQDDDALATRQKKLEEVKKKREKQV